MLTKRVNFQKNIFECKLCDYTTSRKYNYDRHLLTPKHKMLTKTSKKGAAPKHENHDFNISNDHDNNVTNNEIYVCEDCKKVFMHKSSLSRHKSKCKTSVITCEYMKKLEAIEKKIENIQKQDVYMTVNNTVNNVSNNINIFLNESCKDAMNISDFIQNMTITNTDLDYTMNNGYANGISNLLTKHLNDMTITQRPIHCSDKKRLKFYIKDEDKWNIDDGDKFSQGINTISEKQIFSIQNWEHENLDMSSIDTKNTYLKMISVAYEENDIKTVTKIKKHISDIIFI